MAAGTEQLGKESGNAIAEALFGKTRRALLAVLFGQPERSFFLTQLINLSATGRGAVQRELERLGRAGIVTVQRRGNQVLYQANPRSPVFPELCGLARKSAGIAETIRAALGPLSGAIDAAFLFGSVARGQQRSESDVDVMVIGETSFAAVVAALRPTQQMLNREINPAVFHASEFRTKLRDGNHFLTRVMAAPKTFLIGGNDELETMAG